jgi:Tfp pilus assembly protein PilO
MKLGAREFIFIALLFIVPVAMWFFVFRPRKQVGQRMMEEVAEKRTRLSELNRARVLAQSNLEDDIGLLEHVLQIVESRQPVEHDVSKILQGLTQKANSTRLRANVQLRGIGRSSETGLPYSDMKVSMELSGAFMDFYVFLQLLEDEPRIIRVTLMELTKATGPDREGHINARLELQIFIQDAEESDNGGN